MTYLLARKTIIMQKIKKVTMKTHWQEEVRQAE